MFSEVPESITNTLRVAEKCDVKIDFATSKYPAYHPPEGKTREQYLRELCHEGLRHRYGERAETDAALMQRMEYELSVLEKAGFTSYFLIVWDFIAYARSKGIPVGPGRGSAAGSMVAYILGITDLDPLRFGLIFERFLNPERVSPPDIDIDFCMERRGEVIEYVRQKYGDTRRQPDRHVRHAVVEGRAQGRVPRAGHELRRRRPALEDDPHRGRQTVAAGLGRREKRGT